MLKWQQRKPSTKSEQALLVGTWTALARERVFTSSRAALLELTAACVRARRSEERNSLHEQVFCTMNKYCKKQHVADVRLVFAWPVTYYGGIRIMAASQVTGQEDRPSGVFQPLECLTYMYIHMRKDGWKTNFSVQWHTCRKLISEHIGVRERCCGILNDGASLLP